MYDIRNSEINKKVFSCNEVIGFIGTDVKFDYIQDIVNNFPSYGTGLAYLINKDGMILVHPTEEFGTYIINIDQNMGKAVLNAIDSVDQSVSELTSIAKENSAIDEELDFQAESVVHNVQDTLAPIEEVNAGIEEISFFCTECFQCHSGTCR